MQPDGTNIFSLETNSGSNLLGLTSVLDDSIWFWRENNAETVGSVDFGWNHMCVEIDTKQGGANISWNGGKTQVLTRKPLSYELDSFILTLGNAAHHSSQLSNSQYDGMIANVVIFKAEKNLDIRKLSSSDLCNEPSQETYISWNEMEFECKGVVENKILRNEEICGQNKQENVLLPKPITFHEAKKSCQLIRNATITEYMNMEDFQYIEHFSQYNQCQQIWTPYSGN